MSNSDVLEIDAARPARRERARARLEEHQQPRAARRRRSRAARAARRRARQRRHAGDGSGAARARRRGRRSDGERCGCAASTAGRSAPAGADRRARVGHRRALPDRACSRSCPGECVLDGTARMRERPIGDLVDALRALGVQRRGRGPGRLPAGALPRRRAVRRRAPRSTRSRSSQYVSALLLVAPYAARDVELRLRDGVLVSRPYVDVTLAADARVRRATRTSATARRSRSRAGRATPARDYAVEPDASTAAYFFARRGDHRRARARRGPARRLDAGRHGVARRARAHGLRGGARRRLRRGARRRAARCARVDVDMNAMPDAVLAAAVTALFADGTDAHPQRRQPAHQGERPPARARDRAAQARRRRARGRPTRSRSRRARCTAREIDTYDDHRMAMAFALAGLRIPGVQIRDPGCVQQVLAALLRGLLRARVVKCERTSLRRARRTA